MNGMSMKNRSRQANRQRGAGDEEVGNGARVEDPAWISRRRRTLPSPLSFSETA